MNSLFSGRFGIITTYFAVTLSVALLFCAPSTASARHAKAPETAHIVVGGHEAPFIVAPFVGEDGQVYAPVEAVYLLGAQYTQKDDHTVTVTSALGKSFSVASYPLNERHMVSLIPLAQQLGASATWDRNTRTLELRAKVLMVKVEHGKLIVATSFPVEYATGSVENPHRDYVDLYGVDLGTESTSIPAHSDGVVRIRSNQMQRSVVRIALDLSGLPKMSVYHGPKVALIEAPLGGGQQTPIENPKAVVSALASNTLPVPAQPAEPTKPSVVSVPSADQSPLKITHVEYVDDLTITTTGKQPSSEPDIEWLNHPYRFAVDIPNASLAIPSSDGSELVINDSNVKTARWGSYLAHGKNYGRIVLDTSNKRDYSVKTENAPDGSWRKYTITIGEPKQMALAPKPGNQRDDSLPSRSDQTRTGNLVNPPAQTDQGGNPIAPIGINPPGDLSPVKPAQPSIPIVLPKAINGMLVIVDPGHGGKDSGAPGVNNLFEKNLNLQIAFKLRDELIAAGAKPIMTRTDDTFIPLADRSQLGIDNKAAIFVSIHCDSGSTVNDNKGARVYYHSNDSVSKTLASIIASHIADSSNGLASDGTRSDYVRFPGVGYSVLRLSPEPAVLVECGYINNDHDAALLVNPDIQDSIAKAIVAGISDFITLKSAKK